MVEHIFNPSLGRQRQTDFYKLGAGLVSIVSRSIVAKAT